MLSLRIRNILAAGILAALPFGYASVAEAATCADRILFKIDNGAGDTNDGCFVGTVNNDNPLPGQVNADDAFGPEDWTYAGKQNFGGAFEPGTVDIGFTITGTAFMGTWSVVMDLFDAYAELMIVAKGPNAPQTDPRQYVGYLFTGTGTAATSGDYMTPFQGGMGQDQGISHWTAYVRGTCVPTPANDFCGDGPPVNQIPVPAGLPLLLTALGGAGILVRRKRKS